MAKKVAKSVAWLRLAYIEIRILAKPGGSYIVEDRLFAEIFDNDHGFRLA